jgi:16S rRNA (cytidine1402-2'-O)-methyltransferase
VSRELTKIHEETVRGTLGELVLYYTGKTIRGEIVIVVEGFSK